MVEENNTILLSIRRNARIGTTVKIIYWTVIIGLSFGAYYFIQPYLQTITGGAFGNANPEKTKDVGGIDSTVSQIRELLK